MNKDNIDIHGCIKETAKGACPPHAKEIENC